HTIFSRDWSSDVCSSDLFCPLRKQPILLFAQHADNQNVLYGLAGQCIRERGVALLVEDSPLRNITQIFSQPPFKPCVAPVNLQRSEERRVGKEGRAGKAP